MGPATTQNPPATGTDAEPVNVLYTGLPPYHPLAIAEGWDAPLVDKGVRNATIEMVQAGYNVYVLAAGPEVDMAVFAEKMRAKGVRWHITGIGMGVRTAKNEAVVHYLEDLIQLFRKEAPEARQVFNNGPGSVLASVQYRVDLSSRTPQRPGRLLGYEELFDGQKGEPLESVPPKGQ